VRWCDGLPPGSAQDTYSYEPYGVTAINGSVPNPWQFASGYHDTTNWYKFGMRYYAARLGRWSQLDPKEQPTDPVQADRYAYAGNDPVNHVDPMGQDFPCILFCDPSPGTYGHPNRGGPGISASPAYIEGTAGAIGLAGSAAIYGACYVGSRGALATECGTAAAALAVPSAYLLGDAVGWVAH
jgi:RHS repeat-associated protein